MTDTAQKTKSQAVPVTDLSFEEALAELETIVKSLESGQAGLEKSIHLYDRGMVLRKHCETKLSEAQAKVEKITLDNTGQVQTAPLDE